MSQTPTSEAEQIELDIKNAQAAVDLRDLVLKLNRNPAFRKVVNENYFEKEAARLALLLTDPAIIMNDQATMVHNDIAGVGAFKRYLSILVQMGNQAEDAILNAEAELEDIRAEEQED